ncbi:MAG: DUF342 domain-containing protein [Candidatus Coatesbacteria bacterium]|nr:DUF342 domain-containing protein [Candidatus Coatesbacteria bacterium]
MELFVSEDELQAFLLVSEDEADSITFKGIINFLAEKKIIAGILYNNIKKIIDDKHFNKKILVAQGSRMIPLDNTSIRLLVFEEETYSDGKAVCEGHPGVNVVKGQILAVKTGKGQQGFNIHGEIEHMQIKNDIPFPAGDGTEVLKTDSRILVASWNGFAVFKENKIFVEKQLIIHGNADKSTGNIFFVGNAIIDGDVSQGISIEIWGNTRINGRIDDSILKSCGDLFVSGDILESEIEVNSNINCKSIINSSVKSRGKVEVSNKVKDSEIVTSDWIEIKGELIKSSVSATKGIKVFKVKGESSLEIGLNPIIEAEITDKVRLLEEISTNRMLIKKNIEILKRILKSNYQYDEDALANCINLISNPPLDIDLGNKLSLNLFNLYMLEKREEEVRNDLKVEHGIYPDARIEIEDSIEPPVEILLGKKRMTILEDTGNCIFTI